MTHEEESLPRPSLPRRAWRAFRGEPGPYSVGGLLAGVLLCGACYFAYLLGGRNVRYALFGVPFLAGLILQGVHSHARRRRPEWLARRRLFFGNALRIFGLASFGVLLGFGQASYGKLQNRAHFGRVFAGLMEYSAKNLGYPQDLKDMPAAFIAPGDLAALDPILVYVLQKGQQRGALVLVESGLFEENSGELVHLPYLPLELLEKAKAAAPAPAAPDTAKTDAGPEPGAEAARP